MNEMQRTAQMTEWQEIGERGCNYGCIYGRTEPGTSYGGECG